MPDVPVESPYPIGTQVKDPRLLQNRRAEIALSLEAVAPEEGDRMHAVLIGEQHSGRSSVLAEVARRAQVERDRLVVMLTKPDALPQTRQSFVRHLLIAVVEALAETVDPNSPWYVAWRQRVYLRDTAPVNENDLLSSALILATDPDREIDRIILERDLASLSNLAAEAGSDGIVVCVDDASPLTEDIGLVEGIVDIFDSLGGYALLMAGLPSTADHFTQAASPCLQRFTPVWLGPFYGPRQVFTALSAPLSGADRELLGAEDADLLRDVLQLTGGNPYEMMIVAHHLWLSCQLGEQDHYVLTSRVLDRIIPNIAMLAVEGDALRDGAEAIDLLPEDQVGEAVELASLSRLSVREIAITRLLKVGRPSSPLVRSDTLGADIPAESERVLAALEGLQEVGVVQLHPDNERFHVVGGRPASVLLKYKARARIGAEAVGQPFELGFLLTVGRALARDASLHWLEGLSGGNSLGFNAMISQGGVGRHSPRPAIRSLSGAGGVGRLIEADIDLMPWNADAYDRVAGLLAEDDPHIALACTSLMYRGDQLEYLEAWQLPVEVCQEDLDQTLSEMIEAWVPLVEAAELTWSGSEGVVLRGEAAREALIVLQRFAATSAVHVLFRNWLEDRSPDLLRRARQVASEAVATMRQTGQSDVELGGELSGMLSRLGFLQSFEDSLIDEAHASLEEALRIGPADGWVTRWNAANVYARRGEEDAAIEQLDALVGEIEDWDSFASLFFYVPNRPTSSSMLKVTRTGIEPLVALQRAMLRGEADADLKPAVERCLASDDEGATMAVQWMREPPALAA